MKKLLLCFFLVLILAPEAHALRCASTTPGYVFINGRRTTTVYFKNRRRMTISCTLKRPGYMYWRGGNVCVGGYVYGWNYDYSPFWCRVLSLN